MNDLISGRRNEEFRVRFGEIDILKREVLCSSSGFEAFDDEIYVEPRGVPELLDGGFGSLISIYAWIDGVISGDPMVSDC